jgi:glycosyltransferase involved in cell wall biosynthesis
MALASATVVPSRSEGFGLVNIESLAVGTPVVASSVGGIVEVIRDGVDGFLVPPDNPEEMVEKLLLLLSNAPLRRAMSRNARERFLTTFEQGKVVREQADWFEKIVNERSGSGPRMPGWVGERTGLGAASIFGIFGSKD